MGMDIHVYVEQKNKDTGKWEYAGLYDLTFETHYDNGEWRKSDTPELVPANIYTGRNYDLFSLLGETLRGSYQPVVPIHGKPDDLSDEVYKLTLDEETGEPAKYFFGYNWLTFAEFEYCMMMLHSARKASKRQKEQWRTMRSFYEIVYNAMWQASEHNAGYEDTRIVYWFDN